MGKAEHGDGESWIEDKLAGCMFANERLGKCFRTLVEQLDDGIGESFPMDSENWAGKKAAFGLNMFRPLFQLIPRGQVKARMLACL